MTIPLSSPDITEKDRRAVLDVLRTPTLSLGPKREEFQRLMAQYAHRKYAIAVNSGTAGLHLIVRSLGIGKGDEVITTTFSFIASSNCILYEGAKPVFVDIDEKTLNIDPAQIEEKITSKTKAVLVVDVFGHAAQWDAILRIAKKHNLKVIEDAAEAIGGTLKGKPCGSFGDAAIFSFYPNKQMTTGEGGVVLTDSKKIADNCLSLVNQGRKVKGGKWLEHIQLGYNYRLPEMQCALGISQLSRIEEILGKRDKAAKYYNKKLKQVPGVEVPYVVPNVKMSWFVYVIRLSKEFTRKQRDAVVSLMAKEGIQTSTYFQTIHLQPFYRQLFNYKEGDFPLSESMSARTIALPFFSNISQSQMETVVEALKVSLAKV